ncbi:MAG: ATP-binding protein, partial [bacterium]|nr:ATP-binding protein [bacterium]
MSQDNKKQKLKMSFDPLVIDDLGAKLYSTLPPIISELIANGYDACATKVWIELAGTGEGKSIIITDNGVGMTFDEVDDKYL